MYPHEELVPNRPIARAEDVTVHAENTYFQLCNSCRRHCWFISIMTLA